MVFARAVLGVTAVVFGVIGVGFLWAPVAWAEAIDVVVATPLGRTDVRATYGGFVLATGVFLAAAALRRAWVRPGLAACALFLGGFALGRLVGLLAEGVLPGLMWFFLAVEVGGALAAVIALRRLPVPAA